MRRPTCILLFLCAVYGTASAQTDRNALTKEFNRLDSICMATEDNNPGIIIEKSKKMLEIARVLQSDTLEFAQTCFWDRHWSLSAFLTLH